MKRIAKAMGSKYEWYKIYNRTVKKQRSSMKVSNPNEITFK
jgi:hypothetical protein